MGVKRILNPPNTLQGEIIVIKSYGSSSYSRRYRTSGEGISPKEWMLLAAIGIVFIILAIFITGEVQNSLNERNTVYFSAHKVEDKATMDYTMETRTNNLMVYGVFTSNTELHTKRVSGNFAYLSELVEKYTRHTRTVTDSDGKTKTETYYSWDPYQTNIDMAPIVEVYGHLFNTSTLTLSQLGVRLNPKSQGVTAVGSHIDSTYIQDSMFASVGDLRYSYTYVPNTFTGNMLIKPVEGGAVAPFEGQKIPLAYGTIAERLDALEAQVGMVPLFTGMGVILLGLGVLYLLYKFDVFVD